jgi:hypothetical protein
MDVHAALISLLQAMSSVKSRPYGRDYFVTKPKQAVGRRFKASWPFLNRTHSAYSILKHLCFDELPDQSTMAAITFANCVVSH